MTDAAAGILVHLLDQLLDRGDAVAHDVPRHPLRHRDELAVDDQHPVVLAGDEALHDHAAAVLPRDLERPPDVVRRSDVDRDPPAVIRVEGLHHDRIADPLRRGHRIVGALHQPLPRDREAEVGEDTVGLLLVGGELDRDVRGAAGDGRLDPLLEPAVPELDHALLVEPDPRDLPLLGRPDQRHRTGPERPPLREPDELVPLGGKVEVGGHGAFGTQVRRQERMEQHDAEPSRLEADVLLLVLVDDVILTGGAVGAGLAEGHRLARDVLHLDGDVLEDVPHPGALILGQAPDEPAGFPVGAAVLLEPRQRGDQAVVERGAELPGGPLLQLAEVHVEPDDGEVSVEARSDVDGLVEDAHGVHSTIMHILSSREILHPERSEGSCPGMARAQRRRSLGPALPG